MVLRISLNTINILLLLLLSYNLTIENILEYTYTRRNKKEKNS